jgi:hypothetical protein
VLLLLLLLLGLEGAARPSAAAAAQGVLPAAGTSCGGQGPSRTCCLMLQLAASYWVSITLSKEGTWVSY